MLVKLTCLNTIIAQKWLTVDTLAYGSQLSYVLAVCVIANARDGERPFEMNYFTRYDQIIVTKGYKEYHCIIYAGKGLFILACTHIQQTFLCQVANLHALWLWTTNIYNIIM